MNVRYSELTKALAVKFHNVAPINMVYYKPFNTYNKNKVLMESISKLTANLSEKAYLAFNKGLVLNEKLELTYKVMGGKYNG